MVGFLTLVELGRDEIHGVHEVAWSVGSHDLGVGRPQPATPAKLEGAQ
jgi:hypothetical protein